MQNIQNLKILQTLYRLQALGFSYIDPVELKQTQTLFPMQSLDAVANAIQNCHLCSFRKGAKQSMSGFGSQKAQIVFIDFFVSATQDEQNSYFVGRSGEMLQKMIQNVLNLKVEEIYYTHALKCRPLSYKENYHEEWECCKEYLFTQLELIQPKVVVTLGKEAYNYVTGDTSDFEAIRGHVITFQKSKLIPMYHPSHLLRNPNLKKIVYNDLKTIKSCL